MKLDKDDYKKKYLEIFDSEVFEIVRNEVVIGCFLWESKFLKIKDWNC